MPGDLDGRMIGVTLDELTRLPNRLCIAGGPDKVEALRAALRGGYVTLSSPMRARPRSCSRRDVFDSGAAFAEEASRIGNTPDIVTRRRAAPNIGLNLETPSSRRELNNIQMCTKRVNMRDKIFSVVRPFVACIR